MSDIVPALLAMILFIITLTTVASTVITSADEVRHAMEIQEDRTLPQVDTEINTFSNPIALLASSTIELTLQNLGNTVLADFSHWDVIAEIQQATSTANAYLSYTTSTTPNANEWTLLGIYNNASSTPRVIESFGPGILDPGESMVALLNPSPSVVTDTYDRVTFVTPNGVTAKVIFRILPSLLYVLDATDATVYVYEPDGTLYDTQFLDNDNGDARGITTNQGFWTTDYTDDLIYHYSEAFSPTATTTQEASNQSSSGITTDGNSIWIVEDTNDRHMFEYDMSGNYITKVTLDNANRDSTGVTTDGTNIWTVDENDDTVYKYDMTGTLVDSFALTAANADGFGITTDGTNIWVVDVVDAAVYKYDMAGVFDSSFNLTAVNADPQGITVIPR
ncbi:MAG: hypothetical protein QF898_00570 [SAR202 cluster bacterium]|jgi:archaellum component FlaF (FlaF/FlaG flagellin family)|nr:hypothetical protein [SAR202 cluster bacterium]MDP6512271.1 hypothetical protein [SAR202 cluster bacterium]MDP6713396.1 hypothetical protein [SAR202 cluster bacterium]